jgi:ribA/ribD-fused uncharacterized protein
MSNFYPSSFEDEHGIEFNCSEQYFMYYKCKTFDPLNVWLLSDILKETNPSRIKVYGRKVRNYDDTIWDSIRESIMYQGVMYKFTQNEDLKEYLLQTYDKTLYEAAYNDNIWGIGYNKDTGIAMERIGNQHMFGRNLLGKILMDIRSKIL